MKTITLETHRFITYTESPILAIIFIALIIWILYKAYKTNKQN